ncbi:class I SAM-dependent methyltransferase [Cellulomonas xylanilytica]|uniref:Uncharacterized protein n=1 Tax=Cellulomonas xylanilytica TaxID=233583 RepID=A0A510VAT8_9CELL|nr:methyltransferase domain-containing protein [Cellulomonas xylanilytica]GEK22285.1 hypothetical protein CXY01_28050 [Cellulomonas xylanilytica]
MPSQDERRAILTELGGLGEGKGLEIGPLHRPIALRPACDVRYVDIYPTETMRERYGTDPDVAVEDIPHIDLPLHDADGVLHSLRDVTAGDAPYRWVLASHVVEHVPDLIGWLSDVAAVLEDGGVLALAVPDRRYSFDALRPQTTVGQVLGAHEAGDTRPSVRAVYDHFLSAVRMTSDALWAGAVPTLDDRAHDPELVPGLLARRAEGEYIDVHVWTFTPTSFAQQVAELAWLGAVDFTATQVTATARNELEFYARLERIPRGASADERAALAAGAVRHVADEEPPAADEPPVVPAEPEPDGIRTYVSAKELQLIRAKRRLFEALRPGRG